VTGAVKPAARDSELYCAGYIEQSPSYGGLEIVGGEQEQEKNSYGFGDIVYLNGGSQSGVRAGQEFAVVRPRGQFKSSFSQKRGSLGVFTQELGRVRVVDVKGEVSVAQIVHSCGDMMLLGDYLKPTEVRASPPAVAAPTEVNRFANPTGKQHGRIVLARDQRETVSLDQIVYIDLGAEDNVRAGDRLTVFRKPSRDRLVDLPQEIAPNGSGGFESRVFKGGKFSNDAQRAKDLNKGWRGQPIKTPEIKRTRPELPRKIVGEITVIGVQGRTATAVVTRVAQEIHTGDEVEVR
ncbi:MAG: hypothetical protein LC746_15370, partial [Acidobacteria bacterium]|nr:hypothetical protein [Acidobacteriota bacterium]